MPFNEQPDAMPKMGSPTFQQGQAGHGARYAIPLVRPVVPSLVELTGELAQILTIGRLTKGPYVQAYEEAVAASLGVKHAIAVSSGTTGLMLAYQSVGFHGDVLVPSFTFQATVSALIWTGARPIFVDVDPRTMTLTAEQLENALTPETIGIVAVHTFGNPADIETLVRFARQHQLKLIFDAAHGFGTQYHAVPVGIQGDAQVFSTSPTKLLVTGEGGVVTTNSDEIADWIRCGREYGMRGAQGVFAGVNARLSEVHALLGQWSLRVLEQAATHRNVLAARYRTSLCHLPGLAFQEVNAGNRHSWKDFPITIDPTQCGLTRDAVAQYLATKGIETRAYYDPPAHQQLAYQQVFEENRAQAATRERGQRLLPVTEWLSTHILCLPIWSDMPESILDEICEHLIALWAQQGSC